MLSDDQNKALELLLDFIFKSKEMEFSLFGKPGTGKTFLIKALINKLKTEHKFNSFLLCAPTNKAALILKSGINEDVITLHKLLSLSPKIDILEFDLKNLVFDFKDRSKEFYKKLIICDEASMINDDLYEHIIKKCKSDSSKIIFISDSKQLQPVKADNLSKVINVKNKFELIVNHRQSDNDLIDLIESSRNNIITDFTKYSSNNCKLFTSAKDMMSDAISNFKMQSLLEFNQFCKVLTYTNDRVDKFNDYIHSRLTDKEYCFNELLTGYDNYGDVIVKSDDYIIKNVKKDTKVIPYVGSIVSGYTLTLLSVNLNEIVDVFILPRNIDQNVVREIAFQLELIRSQAIKNKKLFKDYYIMYKSFATPFDIEIDGRLIKAKTLDYGYAMTIHKCQSSTYDLVYYDNSSLKFCYNKDVKRQLQYVAMSRVKEQLNILV